MNGRNKLRQYFVFVISLLLFTFCNTKEPTTTATYSADITAITVKAVGVDYKGTISGTNIAVVLNEGVSVPSSATIESLTLSEGASALPAQGGTLNLTNRSATILITAQGGTPTKTYTITISATGSTECTNAKEVDKSRGECNETLGTTNQYSETTSNGNRMITTNSIPSHKVGLFGSARGSLNPNAIQAQSETYTITMSPTSASSFTSLLGNMGPQYSFGVLKNGIELDPIAAEPFPHTGLMAANVNWEWNLEALNVSIGLDCNNAHVQPTGKYHYHGSPVLYLQNAHIPSNTMTLVGYAADGFPIYYKYAYTVASDANSGVVIMTSSYRLKSGERAGDGVTAPCGTYNGAYSADYEYVSGLGQLDEANGRTGVTPEYPNGTYYYVLTDEFPSIPRYFRGTPSDSFKLGR